MYSSWGCRRCSTAMVDWTTTTTTTISTTSTYWCACTTWTVTANYPAGNVELSKAESDSLIQMGRIRSWARPPRLPRRRPQRCVGRVVIAALPRVKIARWRSLKEKRQSWGIS